TRDSKAAPPPARDDTANSEHGAVQGLAADLRSRRVELHDLAGAFALAVEIGLVDDVELAASLVPCGVIERELERPDPLERRPPAACQLALAAQHGPAGGI